MKGIGREKIFYVSYSRGNRFTKIAGKMSSEEKPEIGKAGSSPMQLAHEDKEQEDQRNKAIEGYTGNVINDSESFGTNSVRSHRGGERDSHRGLIE